jgi:hypothetical protein
MGVGASVLLPQSLSSGLVDELIATITSICLDPGARDATPYVQRKPTQHVASGTEWEMLDFWAMDTTTIGGQFRAGEPPFDVSCAPPMGMVWFPRAQLREGWCDPETSLKRISSAFGFLISSAICFTGYAACADSHRVLGELTLHVAQRYGGLVRYDYTLTSWKRADPASDREGLDRSFAGRLARMPGRLLEVEATHIADTIFAGAWLASDDFHM